MVDINYMCGWVSALQTRPRGATVDFLEFGGMRKMRLGNYVSSSIM